MKSFKSRDPGNPKLFYGWYIAGVAFLGCFISVGTGFYAFNAILEPLCALRGWSRTDLNLALAIGTVFGFISQYVYGTILLRTGIRILMLLGSLIGGAAFICIPRVESLWQFYLLYGLLFTGNGAYGGIAATTAVNNWFIAKRGKAISFATSGMSFSGAILPLAALLFIRHFGILNTALYIGLIMMAFGPAAWLIIRDWPEELGLSPDGSARESLLPPPPARNTENLIPSVFSPGSAALWWSQKKLIRTGNFWKLGFSFALLMIGTVGVMSQLKPRFTDIGFGEMTAMMMMAATALAGTAGKYLWGSLCDRFDTKRVMGIMALANIVGLGLALCKNTGPAIFMFIPVFGFSMGGLMSAYPIMVASLFGRESFPSVLRLASLFLMFQLFGYVIAGQSFDRTGSYDTAYRIFILFDVLAAILLLTLKPPVDHRPGA